MEDISFTDTGSSEIPIVLIHGFCESHKMWDNLVKGLRSSNRVLCPDLPGIGKSALPAKKNFQLNDIAYSLNNWLISLNIHKCIMIGHSLGGYVTLAFAEAYSEKLHGFGLFHSTSYADPEEKKEVRNKVTDFLESHGTIEFTDTFIPGLFYRKSEKINNDIEKLMADARSCAKEALMAYTLAMRDRLDLSHLLDGTIPVLFIAGEKDGAVPIEQSKKQTSRLNPHHVHFLPETGHMGMFERKSETTQMVSDFLLQFKN